jgi:hypothetical protein
MPNSGQNSPKDTSDRGEDPPVFPTLIQDVPILTCAHGVHDDLAAVIAAWPTLADNVRATILRLIATGEVR